MPSTRRRAHQSPQRSADTPLHSDEDEAVSAGDEELVREAGSEGEEEEEGPLDTPQPQHRPAPLPPHLKEISSLASWTVSTSKPGCSVAQLRSPSTSLFWQSDGPQPHYLNIHFFKLVAICGMRVYLDFDLDESYTPTKIAFLAGTGYNDLQEFSVMQCEQPQGWVEVDFEGVGEADGRDGGEEEEENGEGGTEGRRMPLLRAMLVQVKIMENHQNGKDTHLRGLQIFARDKTAAGGLRAVNGTGGAIVRRRGKLALPEWDTMPELR